MTAKEDFVSRFDALCRTTSPTMIFDYFVTAGSWSLAQLANTPDEIAWLDERRQLLEMHLDGSVRKECVALFEAMGDVIEEDREQDLLGELYMGKGIGLASKGKGDGRILLTYDVSRLNAELSLSGTLDKTIEDEGYIKLGAPICGCGNNILAIANFMQERGYDPQWQMYFQAGDVEEIAALACYLQTSVYGLAGTVTFGSDEIDDEHPTLKTMGLVQHPVWQGRDMVRALEQLISPSPESDS